MCAVPVRREPHVAREHASEAESVELLVGHAVDDGEGGLAEHLVRLEVVLPRSELADGDNVA